MTRDEWKDYKEFDDLSRDMNGLYSEWHTISEVIAESIGSQTAENTAEQVNRLKAPHLFPSAPQVPRAQ